MNYNFKRGHTYFVFDPEGQLRKLGRLEYIIENSDGVVGLKSDNSITTWDELFPERLDDL